jgi:hypothetical protein
MMIYVSPSIYEEMSDNMKLDTMNPEYTLIKKLGGM